MALHTLAQTSDFYPRPPRGGRPYFRSFNARSSMISIHVPREGDDMCASTAVSIPSNFYPRPPRGGRQVDGQTEEHTEEFLSTSPARGTTK